MQVSEVRVYATDEGVVRGYARITLDNSWVVGDLRIIRNDSGGLFVAMPSKKQRDGSFWEIAYPITAEARAIIEEAVLTKYRAICGEAKRTGRKAMIPERFKTTIAFWALLGLVMVVMAVVLWMGEFDFLRDRSSGGDQARSRFFFGAEAAFFGPDFSRLCFSACMRSIT